MNLRLSFPVQVPMSKEQLALKEVSLDLEDLPLGPDSADGDGHSHGTDELETNEPQRDEPRAFSFDAESLFSASLSKTTLLSREEEIALTRQIARARNQIRRILRQTPRLCRSALADAGRGVVKPEESFREREAV